MTEEPEKIWANTVLIADDVHLCGEWNYKSMGRVADTEYRRADLPPTTEHILADKRVRELVEATDACRMFLALHEAHPLPILAALLKALAQIKEPKP